MKRNRLLYGIGAGIGAIALIGGLVWAGSHGNMTHGTEAGGPINHSQMDHSQMDNSIPADASTATRAFIKANAAMHAAMDLTYTGNADADFIRGMIPHHEGAVEMARIVLEHGSNPQVAELARAIISAQEDEISWMRDWLTANAP